MYFSIFEVSKKPFRSSEEWQEAEVLFEHPEVLPIANHFSEIENRSKAIEELEAYLRKNQLGVLSEEKFILSSEYRKQFYQKHFLSFQEVLKKLQHITAAQFAEDYILVSDLIYDMQNSYIDKYDFYIMLSIDEVIPFDEFMRQAEPDIPFYVGMVAEFQC